MNSFLESWNPGSLGPFLPTNWVTLEALVLNLKRMILLILILFLIFQATGKAGGTFAAGLETPKIVIIEFH